MLKKNEKKCHYNNNSSSIDKSVVAFLYADRFLSYIYGIV